MIRIFSLIGLNLTSQGASTGFMVASSGFRSEGYVRGVCLGDGQTEAEGVPSQGGRGGALLRYVHIHDLT